MEYTESSEAEPLLQVGDTQVDVRDPTREKHAHADSNSWQSSSSLIVANMLGAGVLGLPSAIANMGWIGGSIVLALITTFSVYGGLLLGWLRGNDSSIETYGQLASKIAGQYGRASSLFWKYFCSTIGYIYLLGSCTIYLTTCKISTMQVLQQCNNATSPINAECVSTGCNPHGVADIDETVWLVIVSALLLPLAQIRSLAHAGFLAYLGVGTIAVVNVIVIIHVAMDAADHDTKPVYSEKHGLMQFVNGLTQLTFAYGGHVIMVEILSVMRKPSDWPKAIFSSQLFMFANYAIVGCLGYGVYGETVPAPITLKLGNSWYAVVSNVCLFLHVAMAYCILSTVLTTALVNLIWPNLLQSKRNTAKTIKWFLASTSIMLFCFTVGIIIPFFSNLMNVFASLGIMSLSFFVPVAFFLMTRHKHMAKWKIGFHIFLLVAATVACGFGLWAAGSDIADKWRICHYKIL